MKTPRRGIMGNAQIAREWLIPAIQAFHEWPGSSSRLLGWPDLTPTARWGDAFDE